MSRATIDGQLQADLSAIAERAGCELVHAEFKAGVLRLFIDRPEGVTLAECESVSKQTSALLDVADFGPGRYTLEVSSPGLDRQLYRPADYRRFVGRKVRVTWRQPESGRKQTQVGRLAAFHEERGAEIALALAPSTEVLHIPLDSIEIARLEVEL